MPLRVFRDAWSLIWAIARLRPDVVHLNPSFDRAILRDSFYLIVARLIHRGPIVFFIHGWDLNWERRIHDSPALIGLLRLVVGRADRIYVLARKYYDQLAAWGVDRHRLRVTSTMFDASQFNGLARKRALPAGPGQLQLLFMSRLVPGKGAKETVDAFCIVAESVPGLHLVCAGDGPDSEQLQRRAKERGLAHRVSFPGFVRGSEKAQLLLDSDLFIFPSRLAEGCPVALLEAMGAGLPVVTADAGGIADIFRDGINGVLLGALPDAQAIADAIAGMIGDVAALRRIGLHNAAEAYSRFEAGAWCHALEADYMSLVSSAGSSSSGSRPGH